MSNSSSPMINSPHNGVPNPQIVQNYRMAQGRSRPKRAKSLDSYHQMYSQYRKTGDAGFLKLLGNRHDELIRLAGFDSVPSAKRRTNNKPQKIQPWEGPLRGGLEQTAGEHDVLISEEIIKKVLSNEEYARYSCDHLLHLESEAS